MTYCGVVCKYAIRHNGMEYTLPAKHVNVF